jgi:hypothetical protein
MTVICPGINDIGTNITGVVNVIDANLSTTVDGRDLEPVQCTLESRRPNGASLGQSTRLSRLGENLNGETLNFNTPLRSGKGQSVADGAYFYYRCILPPAVSSPLKFSQIVSYGIDEE